MPGTRIHRLLDDGQIAVRLDYNRLPDLDDLMLDIWKDQDESEYARLGNPCPEDDAPTAFHRYSEPAWQWAKISPCFCGEHGWHWDSRSAERWTQRQLDAGLMDGEPDLLVDRPRGRFIAMEWS